MVSSNEHSAASRSNTWRRCWRVGAGLLLLAPRAFAQEPATEPPASPRPQLGDLSVSGYLRGGFGASNRKGRMTCFQLAIPGGLVSKYRLGNECEVWSETHFQLVAYSGADGAVGVAHPLEPREQRQTLTHAHAPVKSTLFR